MFACKKNYKSLLGSFFFLSAFIVLALPVYAKGELIRVPVFFVTDRNLDSKAADAITFGPHRKYVGECQHDPYMGQGYCVVENTSGTALSPALQALGWQAADAKEKAGSYKVAVEEGSSFDAIEKQFYGKLEDKARKSQSKEIVVFAHGYKNSFEAAMQTAARFSYEYKTAVVLYSWPSVAKLRSYSSDENNNEWSQEHYNDMVDKLSEVCESTPVTLRIYAHSMGSRLVIRATPHLREKPYIKEVALVCPDIDQGLVKHYARKYLSTKGTAKIRLYMSQRDKALAFSQMLHGGYCRLGECADSIASMANFNKLASEKKAADDKDLEARIQKTKHRMQTIDFTEFDKGLIGHKIPVTVMKSMAYTDQPGPGYDLISEESGQRSGSSRFLSKVTHLSTPKTIVPKENCLRLVKSASAASSPQ